MKKLRRVITPHLDRLFSSAAKYTDANQVVNYFGGSLGGFLGTTLPFELVRFGAAKALMVNCGSCSHPPRLAPRLRQGCEFLSHSIGQQTDEFPRISDPSQQAEAFPRSIPTDFHSS